MSEWQKIKTAPRDGTDVLLFDSVHGVIQGRFCPGEWTEDTPIRAAEYYGAVWCLGDDIAQIDVEEFPIDAPCGPYNDGSITHWQPLPSPPKQDKQPEQEVE